MPAPPRAGTVAGMTARRVPVGLFAIPFGTVGLAGTWAYAARTGLAPAAVGHVLVAVAAAVWAVLVVLYAAAAVRDRAVVRADLLDPTTGPTTSLVVLTPLLLAALGLARLDLTAARVAVVVLAVLTVLLGGLLTGQWIAGPLDLDRLHPGWFLPTVAGGLVAAQAAATVGQQRLGQVLFGLGAVCWLVLGPLVLGRLFFGPPLPAALTPTLAIEVAPSAVASLAWFALNGDRLDAVAAGLAGYGVLMVVAQLRLLPRFVRLPFTLGTWGFTFSWAAVATAALHWVADAQPSPAARVAGTAVLAAVTLLVGGIAARTLLALARHELLPPAARTGAPTPRQRAPGTGSRA